MPPLILCTPFQLKASDVLRAKGVISNLITVPTPSPPKLLQIFQNACILNPLDFFMQPTILARIDPAMCTNELEKITEALQCRPN